MQGETQDQALVLQTVASSYEQEKESTSARSAHFWEMRGAVIAIAVMTLLGVLPDAYRGTQWDPEKCSRAPSWRFLNQRCMVSRVTQGLSLRSCALAESVGLSDPMPAVRKLTFSRNLT